MPIGIIVSDYGFSDVGSNANFEDRVAWCVGYLSFDFSITVFYFSVESVSSDFLSMGGWEWKIFLGRDTNEVLRNATL